MRRIFSFLLILVFVFALVGCGDKGEENNSGGGTTETPATKYTVQFLVEGEVYKTLRVEENKTIGKAAVENPGLAGFEFVGWVDEQKNPVDLDTFVVKGATKLTAKFKEIVTDDTLIVDAVKEEGVDYYLVVGWWETTALNADGTPKITSSLTPDTVRVFYANLLLYLKC